MEERFPFDPEEEVPGQSRICRSFLLKLGRTPDKKKRLSILKACSRIRSSWVEDLFWEALSDSSEEVRDFLVRDLAGREGLDLFRALRRLRRPPWYAKSAALRILGMRRDEDAVAGIGHVVGDANADVRRSAAEALGEIGGRAALPLLVRLRKDPNLYVKSAAEEAIRKVSELRFT